MPKFDVPSDHDQFKPKKRMGWMAGFSHIFERKSKPANQQKSIHSEGIRTCISMDTGSKEYIHVSSEFPNTSIDSSQPKKFASLKKFFRSTSFDSSHLQSKISDYQDSLQLSKELSEYNEMLKLSSCLWESTRLSRNDGDLQFPASDKEVRRKQSLIRLRPLGGAVSLGSNKELKELHNRKTRPTDSSRSEDIFEQALHVKYFDDLNNPSTPAFKSKNLQKHIQDTNDLVVSWLDSQEQLKKLDDLRESLRVLDKLKDKEWNNCNTKPACRRSLNFKKEPSFSEQNRARHGFEDRLERNGCTRDCKYSCKAAKDSQELLQHSLEGRSANLRLYNANFSQISLQRNDIRINIAKRLKEPKSNSRSICTSEPNLQGHVQNLPSDDSLSRSEGKNQAPSVVARLMGLDAMPIVPETVTKPFSDSGLEKGALHNQPHEVLSNLQQTQNYNFSMQFYQASNESSLDKNESSLDKNLQIHSSIQSAMGNISTSIAEKQMLLNRDKGVEPLSELESSCTQRSNKEATQSTWTNHSEDMIQTFPAPKHIIHAAVPPSAKHVHSETLSPPLHKEQTEVDGKLNHEIRKSKSKPTVSEDLENRVRQMQVHDSLDGHKTLKEILKTMQLKGLLHIPSLNRLQATKDKHQHEKLCMEQGHKMNTSISNVNVQDSDDSCQSLQLAGHLKAYANESFYKVKCDSGDFKKSPIVLIKPLSGPDKTKFSLLANDGLPKAVKSSRSTKNICVAHSKQGEVKRKAFRKRVHNSLSKTSSFKSHRTSESTCDAWNSKKNEKVSSNQLYKQAFNSKEAFRNEQADNSKQLPQLSPKLSTPQPPSSNAQQQLSDSYKSIPVMIENSKAFMDRNYPYCLSESSSKTMSNVKSKTQFSRETMLHHEITSVCNPGKGLQKKLQTIPNLVSVSLEEDINCSINLPVTPQKVEQSDMQNRECIGKLEITSLDAEILDGAPKVEPIEQEIKTSQTCGLESQQAVLTHDTEAHSDSVKPSLQEMVLLNSSTLDRSATLLRNSSQDTELESRDMDPERQGKGSFLKSSIQKDLCQRPNGNTVDGDMVAIPNKHTHSASSESETLLQLTAQPDFKVQLPIVHLQPSSTLPINTEAPTRGLYQTIQNQQVPETNAGGCLQTSATICQEIMFKASEQQQRAEMLPKELQTEPSTCEPATSTLDAENIMTSHPICIHPSKNDQVAFDTMKMQTPKKKNYPEILTLEHAAKQLLGGPFSAESERPSPVSVLESPFHEDENLIDTTRFSSLSPTFDFFLEDYSIGRLSNNFLQELHLLEMDSRLEADNIPGMVYATFQTHDFLKQNSNASRDHQEVEEGLIETKSGAFQWSQNKEMASIRDILETPEFKKLDLVLTPSKFQKTQGQDLVEEMEQSLQEEKIKKSKLQVAERRLHFDCLNEIIAKNLLPFLDSQPWVPRQEPLLRKKPSEEQLVQQARKEIRELLCFPAKESSSINMLYTILERDSAQAQWIDLKADIVEIGLSLASLILDETITETTHDLIHLAQGEPMIP